MSKFTDLTESILPQVAKSGRLGSEVQFVKCILDDTLGERQFASSVCFVVAVFRKSNKTFEQPLIIKYNIADERVRNWLKLDEQFKNEVVVYGKILPSLHKINNNGFVSELFPRYFFGSASQSVDPNAFIIILEDLRASGFTLCPEILDLNFDQCALAFKKLGIFHALSYAAKQLNHAEFYDTVKSFIETRLFLNCEEDWEYLYKGSVERASKPLLQKGIHTEKIENFINKLEDSLSYFRNILEVTEPMGVICHGDFNRNNLLFKYENNIPIDIKFFDLATARYGSPMLDFTFFFWLNCSEELRYQHREEFLNIYYSSLSSAIPGVNIPPFESFQEEFKRKAVYGFLLCSFFKPAMMDPEPFRPLIEVRKSVEERSARVLTNGGDQATSVIANMLNELIELKCTL